MNPVAIILRHVPGTGTWSSSCCWRRSSGLEGSSPPLVPCCSRPPDSLISTPTSRQRPPLPHVAAPPCPSTPRPACAPAAPTPSVCCTPSPPCSCGWGFSWRGRGRGTTTPNAGCRSSRSLANWPMPAGRNATEPWRLSLPWKPSEESSRASVAPAPRTEAGGARGIQRSHPMPRPATRRCVSTAVRRGRAFSCVPPPSRRRPSRPLTTSQDLWRRSAAL